jgi:hypothetical protein
VIRCRSGKRRARDASGRTGIMSGHGVSRGEWPSIRGTAVPGGGFGVAAPSARGRDGRGRQPPGLPPRQVRAWSPPSRTRELAAREQPTSSTTRARRGPPVTGRRSKADARRWAEGEGGHHPSPFGQAWKSPRTCQERFASLRDGLRPHLTEPLRQANDVRSGVMATARPTSCTAAEYSNLP